MNDNITLTLKRIEHPDSTDYLMWWAEDCTTDHIVRRGDLCMATDLAIWNWLRWHEPSVESCATIVSTDMQSGTAQIEVMSRKEQA